MVLSNSCLLSSASTKLLLDVKESGLCSCERSNPSRVLVRSRSRRKGLVRKLLSARAQKAKQSQTLSLHGFFSPVHRDDSRKVSLCHIREDDDDLEPVNVGRRQRASFAQHLILLLELRPQLLDELSLLPTPFCRQAEILLLSHFGCEGFSCSKGSGKGTKGSSQKIGAWSRGLASGIT